MLKLNCLIKITDPTNKVGLQMSFVNEILIEKSRKTLTNTAKITIARKLHILKADTYVPINTIFQRGFLVEIQLGYDGNFITEFSGYISDVGAKTPLEVSCQDEMWSLKQNSFSKSWKKVKVAEIIKFIYTGPAQVVDLEIGGLIVKQQSTAQILDDLRKFGLQCYFDGGVLIVDFAGVVHNQGKEVVYDVVKNVIDFDSLEYKRKEDARIKIRAISKLHTGKKIEIVVGDNDGEEHTLHYVNMDKDQLQKIATAELDKLKYDGYKGSFTAFGIPYTIPGDYANLHDDRYPENDGTYLVQAVKTTFGVNGFRREIELERKLA